MRGADLRHVPALDRQRRRGILLTRFLDVAHVETEEDGDLGSGGTEHRKPLPEFCLQAHLS